MTCKESSQENVHDNQDMAVLVVSYDGYSDMWSTFFECLNKFWGNRQYPTFLANNKKQVNFKNVSVINCGEDAQWSTRTKKALEKIEEKYVCLLLEDYFIGREVDNQKVMSALELMQKDNLKYYKLSSFSKINEEHYKGIDYLSIIPENLDYGISLQAAIWEKDYLLNLLGTGDYNAWKFEVDRLQESENGSHYSVTGCVFDNRDILNIIHGVAQGKYLPPAVDYFKKMNMNLNTELRPVMQKNEYLYYRLKGIGKKITPKKLRSLVKKTLSVFGFKFVTIQNKNK